MAKMIPVQAQPEPPMFDAAVRKKGLAHLHAKGYALDQPLPAKAKISPYWRECLSELHYAHGGVCAYLCLYFERIMGGGSVDHFIAKSSNAGLAYEWTNYRLACSTINSRKRDYSDVLDPFELAKDWFRIQLATGHIYPNPDLDTKSMSLVGQTIERLGLDDSMCRELRARWYQEYLEYQLPSDYLQMKAPFIWREAQRQGLLLTNL